MTTKKTLRHALLTELPGTVLRYGLGRAAKTIQSDSIGRYVQLGTARYYADSSNYPVALSREVEIVSRSYPAMVALNKANPGDLVVLYTQDGDLYGTYRVTSGRQLQHPRTREVLRREVLYGAAYTARIERAEPKPDPMPRGVFHSFSGTPKAGADSPLRAPAWEVSNADIAAWEAAKPLRDALTERVDRMMRETLEREIRKAEPQPEPSKEEILKNLQEALKLAYTVWEAPKAPVFRVSAPRT